MKTFGEKAFNFYSGLKAGFKLPAGIEFLDPFENPEAKKTAKLFFDKFYSDNRQRIFIIGINPGRFGAGTTGIAFTDPVSLENECGIKNTFPKKKELSSDFIYRMIRNYGNAKSFYDKFFLTAVCPAGFIKQGKNINYYDDKILLQKSREFIIDSLNRQIQFGANRNVAICLGEGKNYAFLNKLNEEFNLFKEIIPVSHPRFIMQYKRKKIDDYINQYSGILTKALEKSEINRIK